MINNKITIQNNVIHYFVSYNEILRSESFEHLNLKYYCHSNKNLLKYKNNKRYSLSNTYFKRRNMKTESIPKLDKMFLRHQLNKSIYRGYIRIINEIKDRRNVES